eukprot:214093_1
MAVSLKILSKIDQMVKYAVYGWIRNNEKALELNHIPSLVSTICILYYQTMMGQLLNNNNHLSSQILHLMDLQCKTYFKECDKFGYLCDDGVLIQCEVVRPHSKGSKVFVSLGEHHAHLTENHACWIDLPNTRICSLEKMSEVQIQFKRIESEIRR